MITRKQYRSAKDTVQYFDHNLAQSDYHTQSGHILGTWNGNAAAKLNLPEQVHRDEFERLCNNRNPAPDKNEPLTSRTTKDRTVAEDWTFSVPKSVSIQYAISQDKDIIDAVQNAVRETMSEVEKDTECRVRKDGKYENRPTGNLVWSGYLHDDTRPVEREVNGQKMHIPDPQLHQHVVIMNATFDTEEEQWKAVQFRNMVASIPYYRELFGSRLASQLQGYGYELERTSRNFELAGYQRSTIEKFSKRQAIIEETARQKGITDPAAKAELGAKTRTNKRQGLSAEELRQFRLTQLDSEELKVIQNAKATGTAQKRKENVSAKEAVDHAIEHGLARQSVIGHRELLKHALNRGKVSVTKEELEKAIEEHDYLHSRETKDGLIYTNTEAHVEEKKLVAEARNGKGKYKPINPDYEPQNGQLTKEQKKAVHHALQSRDFITMITGRAGTGKTWSVREIAEGTQRAGLNFGAFAPSTEASRRVQREDGFENATTIAELLVNQKRHEEIKGGVIWVDEAGMVGNATMNKVINLAKQQNARILLTGDTRQHNSVERGDAMRIIERYAHVPSERITKNQRQKSGQYREAVEALSKGQMEKGYTMLDKMGAVKEAEDMDDLTGKVAEEYVQSVKLGERAIVIAVTHAQGRAVTETIRSQLKKEGRLKEEEAFFPSFKNMGWDTAQKKDRVNYQPGQVVEFHQNVKGGYQRGSRFEITGTDNKGNVLVKTDGQKNEMKLPMGETEKFSIFEKTQLPISAGEQVRITKSGFSQDNHRLENGDLLSVKGLDEHGNIRAYTGRKTITIDKGFGHLAHGYTVTSQKSQGKTVNKVIVMQGSVSGKASSMEQFYVSASRGRFSISVHTDDKDQLLYRIQQSSKRMTAMEVAGEKEKDRALSNAFNKAKDGPPKSAPGLSTDWQVPKPPTPGPEPPQPFDPPGNAPEPPSP